LRENARRRAPVRTGSRGANLTKLGDSMSLNGACGAWYGLCCSPPESRSTADRKLARYQPISSRGSRTCPRKRTGLEGKARIFPPTHFVDTYPHLQPISDIFREEQQKIFNKCWIIACHESELTNAFDYRTFKPPLAAKT